jgi:hypothetical protein
VGQSYSCSSVTGLFQEGNPAVCPRTCRSSTFSLPAAANSGQYFATGASRSISPQSARINAHSAVIGFVVDQTLVIVSRSHGACAPRRRTHPRCRLPAHRLYTPQQKHRRRPCPVMMPGRHALLRTVGHRCPQCGPWAVPNPVCVLATTDLIPGRPAPRSCGGLSPSLTAWSQEAPLASESGMRQAITTSQIIHARVRTQATRIRMVCVSEKPSEPTTQPCTR